MFFGIDLASHIYAGADIFLMPSRYEPCGLGQMIAMRYGTVPVVRETGGLADTVDAKVGFKFKEFNSSSLKNALKKALIIYNLDPEQWEKIRANGMKKDFSWNKSAKLYLKMYLRALKK